MNDMKTYLVTGGAGFIGSNFVLMQRLQRHARVINLDLLTYAGNPKNLEPLRGDTDYIFIHGDIGDKNLVCNLLQKYRPNAVVNFAAESHVDRSIDGPEKGIRITGISAVRHNRIRGFALTFKFHVVLHLGSITLGAMSKIPCIKRRV